MIETYKIISGKYDSAITPTLGLLMSDTRKTRGNDFRLQKFNMICANFILPPG